MTYLPCPPRSPAWKILGAPGLGLRRYGYAAKQAPVGRLIR
jgi:hypothetical protein